MTGVSEELRGPRAEHAGTDHEDMHLVKVPKCQGAKVPGCQRGKRGNVPRNYGSSVMSFSRVLASGFGFDQQINSLTLLPQALGTSPKATGATSTNSSRSSFE